MAGRGPGEAPPGRMRSGTRSGFCKLKSYKRATKILIYLLGLTKLDTSGGSGKRTTHRRLSKGLESLNPTLQWFNGPWSWMTQSVPDDSLNALINHLVAIPMTSDISPPRRTVLHSNITTNSPVREKHTDQMICSFGAII